MKEYQRFSPDSLNGSDSAAGLKHNLDKDDNKIIVITIQKLNNLMKTEIVTFRNLEQVNINVFTLFGDKNTKNAALGKSYREYMEDFTDVVTGEARRGFVEVARDHFRLPRIVKS